MYLPSSAVNVKAFPKGLIKTNSEDNILSESANLVIKQALVEGPVSYIEVWVSELKIIYYLSVLF